MTNTLENYTILYRYTHCADDFFFVFNVHKYGEHV